MFFQGHLPARLLPSRYRNKWTDLHDAGQGLDLGHRLYDSAPFDYGPQDGGRIDPSGAMRTEAIGGRD